MGRIRYVMRGSGTKAGTQKCDDCRGKGWSKCDDCKGKGKVPCPAYKGVEPCADCRNVYGRVPCTFCDIAEQGK